MKKKENIQIICGVYEIKNTLKDKRYIGSSKNIGQRWKKHLQEIKNGKHRNGYLQNAFNKYGFDSFTFSIVEECLEEDLKSREQYYIDLYGKEKLYNLTMITVGGGSDVLCNPLYLLNIYGEVVNTFNSGADCARYFNKSLLSYKHINTSSIIRDKTSNEKYRIVTPEFYESNLKEILTWKKIFNISEFKSQEYQKSLKTIRYKIIKEDETIEVARHQDIAPILNITVERARQIISGKLPYLHKKLHCIITKIDDESVTQSNLIKPIKVKKGRGYSQKYKDSDNKQLLLLDLKGNILEKFNSGVELSKFLGKDAIRYKRINTRGVFKNYNTNLKHRVVSTEFYEKNINFILTWSPYTSKTYYNSNFRVEYHLYKNNEYQLKFKSVKTLSKFLSLTEEAVRVCILKGGFHKKSEYQIKQIEVDKNKY